MSTLLLIMTVALIYGIVRFPIEFVESLFFMDKENQPDISKNLLIWAYIGTWIYLIITASPLFQA